MLVYSADGFGSQEISSKPNQILCIASRSELTSLPRVSLRLPPLIRVRGSPLDIDHHHSRKRLSGFQIRGLLRFPSTTVSNENGEHRAIAVETVLTLT